MAASLQDLEKQIVELKKLIETRKDKKTADAETGKLGARLDSMEKKVQLTDKMDATLKAIDARLKKIEAKVK